MVDKSLWIIPIFLAASLYLYCLTLFAPETKLKASLGFPSNLEDLKLLSNLLSSYYKNNQYYVLLLFSSAYLYKQSFMIPGSNILAGAIFGVRIGLAICCFLTCIGASISYYLSKTFLKKYFEKKLQTKITSLQNKVIENKDNLVYYLLFLRLFPMTPNWLLNVTSPIVGIPMKIFFFTVLIGLIPYNYVCVQGGAILASISSLNDIFTMKIFAQSICLAIVALGPSLYLRIKT